MDLGTQLSLWGLIVTTIGALVSVAALVVTIKTLRRTAEIQRRLLVSQRLPALLESLSREHSTFNGLLDRETFPAELLRQSLFRMEAILENIHRKWESPPSSLSEARERVDQIKSVATPDRSTFLGLYEMVGGVLVSLEHSLADDQLRID